MSVAVDWNDCIDVALRRQQAFFDAKQPEAYRCVTRRSLRLSEKNLATRLRTISEKRSLPLMLGAAISGLEWLASG
jgi:hypothetical protein